MKITDILYRIVLISLSLLYLTSHAQVVGVVGRQAAKETYKTTIKHGAKELAKEYAVKSAMRTVTKETIGEICEASAKKAVSKTMTKVASKSAKELLENGIKSTTVKGVTKKAVKGAASKAATSSNDNLLEVGMKRSIYSESRKLGKEANKRKMPNATKAGARQTAKEQLGKEAVESALNKTCAEKWMSLTGGHAAKTRTLLKDLQENEQLRKAIAKDPTILEAYNNAIGSDLRKDLKHLRYIANNADKGHSTYTRTPRSKVLAKGKDLEYKDVRGKTHIVDKNTGETWGTIRKDANGEDVVELKKMKNNPLISDLYPMANTTYVGPNFIIKTDRYGRVWKVKCWIDKNILKDIDKFRDDGGKDARNIRNRVKNFKSNYDVNGLQKPKETYDDASGHLVPHSWGGGTNLLNLIPQLNAMNKSGSWWWYGERQGLQEAENGKKVVRLIELFYPNRSTMRPSKLVVTQSVNGKIQMVKHSKTNAVLEMEAVAFNNMTNAINKKPIRPGRTKRR